jgi:hypothetical protein
MANNQENLAKKSDSWQAKTPSDCFQANPNYWDLYKNYRASVEMDTDTSLRPLDMLIAKWKPSLESDLTKLLADKHGIKSGSPLTPSPQQSVDITIQEAHMKMWNTIVIKSGKNRIAYPLSEIHGFQKYPTGELFLFRKNLGTGSPVPEYFKKAQLQFRNNP